MKLYPSPFGTLETAEQINLNYNEYIDEEKGIRVTFLVAKRLSIKEKIEEIEKAKFPGKLTRIETKEGIIIEPSDSLRLYTLSLLPDEIASDQGVGQ
jgi:hypothetical protein